MWPSSSSMWNHMGDIWFSSTPFYPSFHSIALNTTFILFNYLQVLFCSERRATKILWSLSDGLWDRVSLQASPQLCTDCTCRWPGVGCVRGVGGLVKICCLSSHWEDTYSRVCFSLVVYKEVEGFSFQPVIMVIFVKLEIHFSKRVHVFKGNGCEEIFWDLTSMIALYSNIKVSL